MVTFVKLKSSIVGNGETIRKFYRLAVKFKSFVVGETEADKTYSVKGFDRNGDFVCEVGPFASDELAEASIRRREDYCDSMSFATSFVIEEIITTVQIVKTVTT